MKPQFPKLTVLLAVMAVAESLPLRSANFDWQQGNWGVKVTANGTPGSPPVRVNYPGNSAAGNALEVYYAINPTNIPQFWVFLSDGFFRQTALGSQFLTSYRLFRYWSSDDKPQDNSWASEFNVLEVTGQNQLRLLLHYTNHSAAGDRFAVTCEARLEPPQDPQTTMTVTITASNISGRAVTPCCGNLHGLLRQQWILFALSSMYVADNLTESFPAWYDELDPLHAYVGNLANPSFLDDGHSVNGGIPVATHDVKFISAGTNTLSLYHEVPFVPFTEYDWFKELVMMDAIAEHLQARHGYDPKRHHHVELLNASGLLSNVSQLRWSATFNRGDANMVDGDNVQISLGLDPLVTVWPSSQFQQVQLRLRTGEPLELGIIRTSNGFEVLSNGGRLESSHDLRTWHALPGAQNRWTGSFTNACRFFRQNLQVLGP